MLLGASVASAVLARQNLGKWVTIVTAFAAMVTSYSEFADSGRKLVRYNRAIGAVKRLLTWWNSISDVDQASKSCVNHLILTGESILSEERLGWQATANRPKGTANGQQDGARGGRQNGGGSGGGGGGGGGGMGGGSGGGLMSSAGGAG